MGSESQKTQGLDKMSKEERSEYMKRVRAGVKAKEIAS